MSAFLVAGVLLALVLLARRRRRLAVAAASSSLADPLPLVPYGVVWARDPFTGTRDRQEY